MGPNLATLLVFCEIHIYTRVHKRLFPLLYGIVQECLLTSISIARPTPEKLQGTTTRCQARRARGSSRTAYGFSGVAEMPGLVRLDIAVREPSFGMNFEAKTQENTTTRLAHVRPGAAAVPNGWACPLRTGQRTKRMPKRIDLSLCVCLCVCGP